MNIWHCDLTDNQSTWVRFAISLVWSIPLLAAICWVEPSGFLVLILAVVFLYVSFVGLVLDHWRLRHLRASKEAERRLRLLAIIPVLVGTPLAILFLT